jgi:putative N6-adenine-specific DNA methylase
LRAPAGTGSDFDYQRDGRYFAQAPRGLLEEAAAELSELGAGEVEAGKSGISFRADFAMLCRVNYGARLLIRVLAPLRSFPCRSDKDLYDVARDIPWEKLLGVDTTFAVTAAVSGEAITHSHYAALKVKDAVADRFRDRCGRRPDVDPRDPDLWIHLHLAGTEAVLSADTSGGSLHRRGYRAEPVAAPLQETLGAAMVRFSGWDGERPLVDPFCGSGTILAEALMKTGRVPPGFLRRRFGFQRLPNFEPAVWRGVKREMDGAMREPAAGIIRGSDNDKLAVGAARTNLNLIPHGRQVVVGRSDFRSLEGISDSTIVCNPPYAWRMGEPEEVKLLWKDFGDFLKQRCRGSTAWVLCGNRDLVGAIGLKPARRIPLWNGPLECRLLKIELY